MINRNMAETGRKNIVIGLGMMIIFFLVAMLMGYLTEYDGDDLPPAVVSVLEMLVSDDYLPSMAQFEWHLKYAHVHGEGLGMFCALYGILIGMASRSFIITVTPWLVIAGTIIVPLSFVTSMIYPKMIYGLTFGTVILIISFLLFAYDIIFPENE